MEFKTDFLERLYGKDVMEDPRVVKAFFDAESSVRNFHDTLTLVFEEKSNKRLLRTERSEGAL